MKTSASKSPVLIGLIAATAGFAGLAAIVRNGPQSAPGPLKPEFIRSAPAGGPPRSGGERSPIKRNPKPIVADRSVVRYATVAGDETALTKVATLREGEDARVRGLSETLKSLGYADVRVLDVGVERGLATIDLSPKLLDKGFGSSEEAVLIDGLARTLGQFADVKTFVLRVDGEKVDSLGHLELSEPTDVIRPGQKEDESATPSREPSP